jgi:uncharacterized protein (DUF983 family)
MRQPKSFLYSIVHAKCPRCREGNMFPKGTLYSAKFADMHPHCPCCGQDLEQEPGYYYGAMYVSFGFNVGIFLVSLFILAQLVAEITMTMLIGIVVAVVVGLLPIIFRLSRAIWIHIFIRHDSQILNKIMGQGFQVDQNALVDNGGCAEGNMGCIGLAADEQGRKLTQA